MKYWINLLLLFAFIACSSQNTKSELGVPDWYLQPTKYVPPQLLYGAGEGNRLAAAKERALQNMSYNLQLQVQASSTNLSLATRKGNQVTTSSSLQEEINLRTKKLTFTKVEDFKVAQSGNSYYIIVTTRYADLIATNKQQLDKNTPYLEDALNSLNRKTALQQLTILANNQDRLLKAQDALDNLEILSVAYKTNNISPSYLAEQDHLLRNYNKKETATKRKIILQISGANKWQTAKEVLASNLQAQGYKTGKGHNAIIKVTGMVQSAELFNGKIKQQKIDLLVELQNLKGKTIKSKRFYLKGTSLQSLEEASRKAQNSLAKELQVGLLQALGI